MRILHARTSHPVASGDSHHHLVREVVLSGRSLALAGLTALAVGAAPASATVASVTYAGKSYSAGSSIAILRDPSFNQQMPDPSCYEFKITGQFVDLATKVEIRVTSDPNSRELQSSDPHDEWDPGHRITILQRQGGGGSFIRFRIAANDPILIGDTSSYIHLRYAIEVSGTDKVKLTQGPVIPALNLFGASEVNPDGSDTGAQPVAAIQFRVGKKYDFHFQLHGTTPAIVARLRLGAATAARLADIEYSTTGTFHGNPGPGQGNLIVRGRFTSAGSVTLDAHTVLEDPGIDPATYPLASCRRFVALDPPETFTVAPLIIIKPPKL